MKKRGRRNSAPTFLSMMKENAAHQNAASLIGVFFRSCLFLEQTGRRGSDHRWTDRGGGGASRRCDAKRAGDVTGSGSSNVVDCVCK